MNRLERIHTKEYCSAVKEQATNTHNLDDSLKYSVILNQKTILKQENVGSQDGSYY